MFLILCGKSCSGKDSILKEIVKMGYKPIVSVTSRPIREGETNGIEYEFVSRELFESFIKADRLIEYRTYNTLVNGVEDTWYYGLLKDNLDVSDDHVVILDLNGAKSFMDYYGRSRCFCVYVDAPDEIRTIRAMQRGSFDETEWNRRMAADTEDFAQGLVDSTVNYKVLNTGDLMKTVVAITRGFNWNFT
ncbi:MAG: guanylate kinase Gmk3 [Clostridiales bacterium]|nr:guanylate kinase Gmk3 [Clostridiales bacterium]